MFVQEWFTDVLLKATLILTVAVIADRVIVKSSAATRHWLWSMALLMLLLLPILSASVPQWRLAIMPRGWSDSISQSQVVDESRY